jgi:bifunctional DNA-binding transcriptional regulator/antitoxin component of YhaV-PrlF toxin-antitoxin module
MDVHVILGQKSRTTIPLPLRKLLGWQPGDTLRFRREGDSVTITRISAAAKPTPAAPIESLKPLFLWLFELLGGTLDG